MLRPPNDMKSELLQRILFPAILKVMYGGSRGGGGGEEMSFHLNTCNTLLCHCNIETVKEFTFVLVNTSCYIHAIYFSLSSFK
jgi:hypothetical protein